MSSSLVHLNIGELAVAAEPLIVESIVGSGVCVCLFGKSKAAGGAVHFVYPKSNEPLVSMREKLHFGSEAVNVLIEQVCETSGLKPEDLVAKVVGGAEVGEDAEFASQNAEYALRLLSHFGIPVIGQDLGGKSRRKLIFDTSTGRLRVAPLDSISPQAESTSEKSIVPTSSSSAVQAEKKTELQSTAPPKPKPKPPGIPAEPLWPKN